MASDQTTDLAAGQIWRPTNGDRERQISEAKTAGVTDHGYPMGTVLIFWATTADRWGSCTDRSFRAWIRRTKARLV